MSMNKLTFSGIDFYTPFKYKEISAIGFGGFGLVCSAIDNDTKQNVAIKKIMDPFSTPVLAKRTFRELKLLKDLKHENIISLKECYIWKNDLYLVTELLMTDLHKIIKSKQELEESHIQYFMYQLMVLGDLDVVVNEANVFIESAQAGVIHRDLVLLVTKLNQTLLSFLKKPSNILVDENCDLKLCDFGLARLSESHMTGYVATRFYRAPEIMLSWQKYSEGVDIWSAACIFSELLTGNVLFEGRDHVDQFNRIVGILGKPDEKIIEEMCTEQTKKFLLSLPNPTVPDFRAKYQGVDEQAVDLLEKMLLYDPKARITAANALEHPYFESFHDEEDEPVAEKKFEWGLIEQLAETVADWRTVIQSEVDTFHKEE